MFTKVGHLPSPDINFNPYCAISHRAQAITRFRGERNWKQPTFEPLRRWSGRSQGCFHGFLGGKFWDYQC